MHFSAFFPVELSLEGQMGAHSTSAEAMTVIQPQVRSDSGSLDDNHLEFMV